MDWIEKTRLHSLFFSKNPGTALPTLLVCESGAVIYRPPDVMPSAYLPASNPKTPTPFCVPTYTFPCVIIGVMYLLPFPK